VYTPPPIPARQSGNAVLGAVAAGIAVLAVVAAVALVTFVHQPTIAGSPSAAPYQRPVAPAPDTEDSTDSPEPSTETEPAPEQPPATQAEPTTPQAALAELRSLLRDDRPAVETLADQWVPQLSAKRPGMVVNGITYDYVEILRDFRAIQERYPDALLLFSGEYTSFKYGNFWITVVPSPQYNGESANAWCDGEGIGPDDCYAKMISHTVGYDGATLPR
jgi:serine/threonine-protein kinase